MYPRLPGTDHQGFVSFLADDPPASKKPKTLGSAHYKDAWVRTIAVLCVASTLQWDTFSVDMGKAAVFFATVYGGAAAKLVHENHKVFLQRWFYKFWDDGTVEDRARSGRPATISAVDAKEAGKLLMAGIWRTVKVKGGGGRTEERLFYYTTFAAAVRNCPELKSIMEKYQCSDRLMLAAIHRHCPELVRTRLFSHHEFTDEEEGARFKYGKHMLDIITKDPSILYLIVFCDESTFVLHGRTKHSVAVYCNKEALPYNDVCYISDLDCDPIKVHFFLAVTANDHFQPSGVVLYEVCTGTTNINRTVNKHLDGNTWVGDWEYQVSSCYSGFRIQGINKLPWSSVSNL